jgi:hypothetical protein
MSDDAQGARGDVRETGTLITAALIGAAIGAGLGLLASRTFDEDSGVSVLMRTARKRASRELRRRSSAAGEAIGDARDAAAEFATRARDAFEDVLQREVKQLRKAARRQRRRFGV